jgi:hypothetical protein
MASRAATNADRAVPGIAIAGRAGMEIVLVVDLLVESAESAAIVRPLLQVVMQSENQRLQYNRLRRPWNHVRRVRAARSCRL